MFDIINSVIMIVITFVILTVTVRVNTLMML